MGYEFSEFIVLNWLVYEMFEPNLLLRGLIGLNRLIESKFKELYDFYTCLVMAYAIEV